MRGTSTPSHEGHQYPITTGALVPHHEKRDLTEAAPVGSHLAYQVDSNGALVPHHEKRDLTEAAPIGPNLAYQNHSDGALNSQSIHHLAHHNYYALFLINCQWSCCREEDAGWTEELLAGTIGGEGKP